MGSLYQYPPVTTATADYPELVVEWLPSQGPGAADGDWCDITSYVTQGETSRGRQYETDRFQAGTCSLTLVTATRLFDPEWTSGPFFPWLVPMRQVRISAIWSSVRYPVFRGYITDWGQTVADDRLFTTTIKAVDAFVVLEQIKLPSSAWAMEIVKDDPSLWLRLGETDTVRLTDSSAGGNYGLYDNCQQGVQGLVVNDADSAVAFAHSLEERVVIQNPALITDYPFTFSCMFKISGDDPAGEKQIFTGLPFAPLTTTRLQIAMAGNPYAGALKLRIQAGGVDHYMVTNQQFDDDRPHHAVFVVSAAGTETIYVDGVAQTLTTVTVGSPAYPGDAPNGYVIGNYTDLLYGEFGFGVNDLAAATVDNPFPVKERGTLDEACVWDGVEVTAERVAAHAVAALEGWEGDDTGTRVDRFLDVLDWPATLRDIDSGISILGPASWSAGSSALAALQAWADTELGAFFIGKSGSVTWHSRHYPFLNSAAMTSQATFNDGFTAATLIYQHAELPRDETLIRNPVTASRRNGVSVTVKDATFVEKYGDRTYAMPNSEDRFDSAIRDRALWGLARWKELGTRLANLLFMPRAEPTNCWPQALGRELGDRVTVQRTPLATGNQIATDQIIERIEHRFAPLQWTTQFVGSPVDPNVGTYLIEDDATDGLLDERLLAY